MLAPTAKCRRQLRGFVVSLVVVLGVLVLPPSASSAAEKFRFFEKTASAFWEVPHQCADGSTVQATLLVQTTRDYETPDTEDAGPTARVQYLAACPDGTSFSWISSGAPATVTSTKNLKSVSAAGTGVARDNLGAIHPVTFDVTWMAVGPATGDVTFDRAVLVSGAATHSTRPAPFIRVDIEK